MKLIQPKVEILDKIDGQAILERIEQVARTCYKSEPKYIRVSTDGTRWISEDSEDFKVFREDEVIEYTARFSNTADKFVKRLIESKHEAMLEFVDVTVKFTCSRAISHELVRHRLCSFAQESQRYCNYAKDKFNNEITFIIPSRFNWKEGTVRVGDFEKSGSGSTDSQIFINSLLNAEQDYFYLLKEGWQPQQARDVLPNATKTEINMKANLREWRRFLKLRCHSTAHPDMQVLAKDLLKQMHKKIPVIFEDLYKEYYETSSDDNKV